MVQSTILMIGNCVVDQVWTLEHFPQQDEEMRALESTRVLGGNACNSAQILAKLGNNVELVSSLASDSAAQWILQALSGLGISTNFCVQHDDCHSAQSSIWLNSQNGSRTIVHYRDLPELSIDELKAVPFLDYSWIHFEGRNVEVLLQYLSEVTEFQCPISLEIEKDREGIEKLLPLVDTVIVSSDYLSLKNITAEQCFGNFRAYNKNLNIVCTLGESGLIARSSAAEIIKLAAERVDKVVDTVGAGDSFIGGLIHSLSQQQDFKTALQFASQLAAKKIQNKGMVFEDE